MVEELKDIQRKLDLAHQTLSGISSLLDRLAGRDGVVENMAKQFQTEGREVKIGP